VGLSVSGVVFRVEGFAIEPAMVEVLPDSAVRQPLLVPFAFRVWGLGFGVWGLGFGV